MAVRSTSPRRRCSASESTRSPRTGVAICGTGPRPRADTSLADSAVGISVEKGIDVVAELPHDDVALELQSRGDVTGFLGPVERQDGELANRLRTRHRRVRVVDGSLDLRAYGLVLGQRREVGRLSVRRRPVLDVLGVERDERRDERLSVADDHALADQRMRAHDVLHHRRCDVLTARGDEDLLLTPGDADEPLLVDLAHVAGVEPAVLEYVGCRLVITPVPAEHLAPAKEEFAVLGDLDLGAGDGPADGTDLDLRGQVDRERCGRLRQPVPFEHRYADAPEEVREPLAGRRTAGDGVLGSSTERSTELGVHEPVEHGMLDAEREWYAAPVERFAVRDRRFDRTIEDRSLAVGVGLLARAVEHLLEHPRYGQDERRLEVFEVDEEVAYVGGVPHAYARADAAHLDDPGEDVREREEQQRGGALDIEQLVEELGRDAELEHEVRMGQATTLRASGRARGEIGRAHV